jgi:uncharacterized membrane protein YkvA (DUF1232 family)
MAIVILLALAAAVVFVALAGLAAERQPYVRAVLRRIEPLSHPLRGRLGVWIARDRRVPLLFRFLPITAFVYWVTPIDLVPDPIPKVGYLDDRIGLALALWCVAVTAHAPLEEHLTRIEFLHEAEEDRRADSAPDASDPAAP